MKLAATIIATAAIVSAQDDAAYAAYDGNYDAAYPAYDSVYNGTDYGAYEAGRPANGPASGGKTAYAAQTQQGNYQGYNQGYQQLSCWTCRNAYSVAECQSKGKLETCQSNQESCELEIRERNGYIIQINTGCKQKMACENNKAQNFQGQNPHHTQCRPEQGYDHSVCRQCCYENNCVASPTFWVPSGREEWNY